MLNFLLNVLVGLTLEFWEEAPREHVDQAGKDHHGADDRAPERFQENQASKEDVRDAAARGRHEEPGEGAEDSMTEQIELGGEDEDADRGDVEVDEVPAEVGVEDHLVRREDAGGERGGDSDGLGDVDGGAGAAALAVEAAFGRGSGSSGRVRHDGLFEGRFRRSEGEFF